MFSDPVICGWTLDLLPSFGYANNAAMNMGVRYLLGTYYFIVNSALI